MNNKFMKYIIKHKISVAIIFAINIYVAVFISLIFLENHGIQKINELELVVQEEKNEKSAGNQIRIKSIQDISDNIIDLKQLSKDSGWSYEDDMLVYSGDGSEPKNLTVPLKKAVLGLNISLVQQEGSGIIDVYTNGELYRSVDTYSKEWSEKQISINGVRIEGYSQKCIMSYIVGFIVVAVIINYLFFKIRTE